MAISAVNGNRPRTKDQTGRGAYLFGPFIDFLGLGGASLIALALLLLIVDPAAIRADMAFAAILVAHVINHPHFAHSYQIFYRDFDRKIGRETPFNLRWRYWFAGIIAPAGIALFYALTLLIGDVSWIGYSINAMAFLVGWHYVKQGYGMLSVDSALKKRFFSAGEKKLLLCNAYAAWAFSYIFANYTVSRTELFGVEKYSISFPAPILSGALILMIVFGIATLVLFMRRMKHGAGLPFNGVMAYLVSLYIWQVAIYFHPLFVLVIPAFHSLQYMMVTTRFQLNIETGKTSDEGRWSFLRYLTRNSAVAGLVQFYLVGAVLGGFAFWCLPAVVTAATSLEPRGFPVNWAFAVCWIFVNVHHYLLDNVMWRKGNPDVAKHLFSHS